MAVTYTFHQPESDGDEHEIVTHGAMYMTVFVQVSVDDLTSPNQTMKAIVYSSSSLPDPLPTEPPAGAEELDIFGTVFQKAISQPVSGTTMAEEGDIALQLAHVVAWWGWRESLTDPIEWDVPGAQKFFVVEENT